jgi:hypothetical protein
VVPGHRSAARVEFGRRFDEGLPAHPHHLVGRVGALEGALLRVLAYLRHPADVNHSGSSLCTSQSGLSIDGRSQPLREHNPRLIAR